ARPRLIRNKRAIICKGESAPWRGDAGEPTRAVIGICYLRPGRADRRKPAARIVLKGENDTIRPRDRGEVLVGIVGELRCRRSAAEIWRAVAGDEIGGRIGIGVLRSTGRREPNDMTGGIIGKEDLRAVCESLP